MNFIANTYERIALTTGFETSLKRFCLRLIHCFDRYSMRLWGNRCFNQLGVDMASFQLQAFSGNDFILLRWTDQITFSFAQKLKGVNWRNFPWMKEVRVLVKIPRSRFLEVWGRVWWIPLGLMMCVFGQGGKCWLKGFGK